MSFLDEDGHTTIEVGPAHVGSDKHAPRPMAHQPAKRWYDGSDPEQVEKLVAIFGDIEALAGALGLRWCADCHDFHEVAGGPSPGQRAKMPGLEATGGVNSVIAGGDSAPSGI